MKKQLREFFNWLFGPGYGVLLLVALMAVLAMGLLYVAQPIANLLGLPGLAGPIENVARLFAASVIVAVITRARLWKEATDTFYERVRVKEAITNAGFDDFWWFSDVPWRILFEDSDNVKVVAISANTLLAGNYVGLIRDFLRRTNTQLSVVLADPQDDTLMAMYDTAFGHIPGTRKNRVIDSITGLQKITKEMGAVGRVTICRTSTLPKYSCYQFNDKYLYVPYLTKAERSPERVPVLCFKNGSFVDKYLAHDLSFVFSQDTSKRCDIDGLWLQRTSVSATNPTR